MRNLASMLALLLALPFNASGLGLGDVELFSALNEPLDARITLNAVKAGDLDSLQAGLASNEQFQRAGIDRPFILTKIRFNVVADSAGGAVIHLTTRDPVSEPFLNFLLELNWSSGRLIREYTMLLDPPVYGAAIQAVVEEAISTVDELPELGEAEAEVVVPSSAATVPSGAGSALIPSGSYGPVRTNDTLWSIAESYRPDQSVTTQQVMLAILRANPEGFAEDNVNMLRAGAVLRIPDLSEMNAISAEAALAEVKRQHARWQEHRQAIAASVSGAAQGSVAESTSPSTASTKTAASGEEVEADSESTVSQEAEGEARLELVSAGSATDGVGSDSLDIAALRDQLSAAMEQIDSGNRQNEDLRGKLGEAEKIISDLQRFIELKDDNIATLQDQLAQAQAELDAVQQELEAQAELSVEAGTSETTDIEQEQTTEPKGIASTGTTVPVPSAELPKSFMDSVRDMLPVDPIILVAGGGGVLVLGLLAFLMARRHRGRVDSEASAVAKRREPSVAGFEAPTEVADYEEEDAMEPPPLAAAAVTDARADEEEDDDEEATVIREAFDTSVAPAGAPRLEEEDPLEGLNIYLAYEDYDNATKLVRSVIQKHPDRQEYKLRLLEIFYAAKNPTAFEAAARELQRAIGDDHVMMDKARQWWTDLSPERELFAEGRGDVSVVETAGDDIFDVTGEVDHTDTMEISLDEVEADGGGGGVDFDLGFEFDGAGLDVEKAAMREAPQTIDFDLGGGEVTGGGELTSASSVADVDFDIDFAEGALSDAVGEASRRDPEDTGLDFDLDVELPSGVRAAPASEEGLGFDFDAVASGAGAAAPEASSAAEALDLDVDLEFPAKAEALSAAAGEDFDFVLDIDAPGEVAPASAAPPAGTDLDLDLDADLAVEQGGGGSGLAADLDFGLDLDEEAVKPSFVSDDGSLDFDLDIEVPGAGPSGLEAGVDVARGVAPASEMAQAELDQDLTLDLSQLSEDDGTIGGIEDTGDLELDLDVPAARSGSDASKGGGDELDLLFNLDDADDMTHLSTDSIALVDIASEEEEGVDVFSNLLIDTDETVDRDADDDTETTQFMLRDVKPVGMVDLDAADDILDLTFGEEGDSADLDLTLGAEDVDETGGFEQTAVNLTIDGASTEPAPDFETVQLRPGDLARVGIITPEEDTGALAEESVEVDGDFAGLFGDAGGLADDVPELDIEFPDSALAAEEADVPNALDMELDVDEWSDSSAQEGDADEDEAGQFEKTQFMLRDIAAITTDPERPRRDDDDEDGRTLALGRGADDGTDAIQTKLDLAQAYIDMGDVEGARGILGEVMAEGDYAQQSIARDLLTKLS